MNFSKLYRFFLPNNQIEFICLTQRLLLFGYLLTISKNLEKNVFSRTKKLPSGWGVKASPISPCMHPAQRGTVAQQTRLKPSNSVVTEK